ncbi:MAG: hypothetical protein RI580_02185 [Halothece sp. Uz-M2-17]|nr:hypothetical protein [Halothece sp. Uz-M2-17]
MIAFRVEKQGSYRLQTSDVLPDLELDFIKTALRKSRNISHTEVGSWLLQQSQN